MEQILVPMVVFTATVLLLSGLVLGTRRWLIASEPVSIVINGSRKLRVWPGNTLLATLAEQGVYLPAACGGRGTCGQCRVTVLEGRRDLLATEATHIGRRDAAAGVRLACMLKVRESLALALPASVLEVRSWLCTVVSNRSITTFLKELVLALPEGERIPFQAGDYVLLEAPPHTVRFAEIDIDDEYRAEWERYRLLGLESKLDEPAVRAYSLANSPQHDRIVTLVVRIATPPVGAPPGTPPGKVSSYIFGLGPGDRVRISGPFGEFHARDSGNEMVLIAGGAGIAPIRSIILDQLARGSDRKMSFWYGVRNLRELCYVEELDRLAEQYANFTWCAALSEPRAETRWDGYTGFIHQVVYEQYLAHHPAPEDAEYYLCGPPVMSGAVLQMLEDLGVERENIFFDDFGA